MVMVTFEVLMRVTMIVDARSGCGGTLSVVSTAGNIG